MNQTDPTLYKVPPQDLDIESSILSTCLLFPNQVEEIIEGVNPSDFYRTAHSKIFQVIMDLFNEKQETDLVSVTSRLRDVGHLEETGGASYLSQLTESPISTNIQENIKTLKSKAILRRVIETAGGIIQESFEYVDDIDRFLNNIHSKIVSIDTDDLKAKHITAQQMVENRIDHYEEIIEHSKSTGIRSGYYDLDELTYGFQNSNLIIIAARPSMGKTALMLNLAKNQTEGGDPVALFSLEQSDGEIGDRSFALTSGVNGIKFRSGKFSQDDWHKITNAASQIHDNWKVCIDDTPNLHYMEIWKRARRYKREMGIKIIYIDYLGFVKGDHPDNTVKDVESITRGCKSMAKDLDMPVVLLCQLNRNLEHRPNKRPKLSDLRDSGAIEQDADLVIFIYRDEVYYDDSKDKGVAEIILAKQRNGPKGMVKLAFHEKQMLFQNIQYEGGQYG